MTKRPTTRAAAAAGRTRAAPRRGGLDPQGPGHRAGGDAGQAGEALVGAHAREAGHGQVRRAGLRAEVAVDARGRVPRDLERREKGQRPEERAVGAEVAAPGVGNDDGEHGEADQDRQREGREPLEEVEHLHVGHPVVGRVEEVGDGERAHLEEDRVDEEGEEEVLDRPERQVDEARQAELPAEEALREAGQDLGDRPHRADPRAEGLLDEDGHADHEQQDREAGGVDGVDLAGCREVAQAQERRDRQEGLDTRRARADDSPRLEAVHPAHEPPPDRRRRSAGSRPARGGGPGRCGAGGPGARVPSGRRRTTRPAGRSGGPPRGRCGRDGPGVPRASGAL